MIKTWQERTAACEAPRHHDFHTCMMQAEINDLRAALAAKLVPMTPDEIEDMWESLEHKAPVYIVRAVEAHHSHKAGGVT